MGNQFLQKVCCTALLAMGAPGIVCAQLRSTPDARLHACVVDGDSGEGVDRVGFRILGEKRLLLFDDEDVTTLGQKTHLFAKNPVVFTDQTGCVSISPPDEISLSSFAGIMMGPEDNYVLAHYPGHDTFCATSSLYYLIGEITNRQFVVSGNIHAAYFPPLRIVQSEHEKFVPRVDMQASKLKLEIHPRVVRPNEQLSLTATFSFIAMPLMTSDLECSRGKVKKIRESSGTGRVSETWQVSGIEASKRPGRKSLEVEAYLDAPHLLSAAVTSEVSYVVTEDTKEREAYEQLFELQTLDARHNEKVANTCVELVKEYPDMVDAWVELARRYVAEEKWNIVVSAWNHAPDEAKKRFAFVSAWIVAMEKLGRKDEQSFELLLASAEDTPKNVRRICFQEALQNGILEDAAQIGGHLFDSTQWYRMKRWLNGDQDATGDELMWTIQMLNGWGLDEEVKTALQKVDLNACKYTKSDYWELIIERHLAIGEKEQAMMAYQQLVDQSGIEKTDSYITARIEEARGNLDKALAHYATGYVFQDKNSEGYVRTLVAAAAEATSDQPKRLTSLAMSLIAFHEFAKAVPVARRAVEHGSELAAAHLALGLALQFSGQPECAVESLDRAASLAESNAYILQEQHWGHALVDGNPSRTAQLADGIAAPGAMLDSQSEEEVLPDGNEQRGTMLPWIAMALALACIFAAAIWLIVIRRR